MARWQKHFRTANAYGAASPMTGSNKTHPAYHNYQSQLPDVYIGHPNRVERYNQYEQMDGDAEINGCLDIIADFSTQLNIENNTAFRVEYHETPTDSEVEVIKTQLQQWYNINQFDKRIFKLFRNTIKYGDQVFIRDPETFQLSWVDMSKVVKVIVNESEGKEPEQYVIKDINVNLQNLTVTQVNVSDVATNHPQVGGPSGSYTQPNTPYSGGSRFDHKLNEDAIEAEHIVHLSLTEGLDTNWPFGNSVLENIFKVFKQKELLEDAILIYRIQRAPERRVFYVDVGDMPAHLAMAFLERTKNEIHQRRIPSQTGGGANVLDASYNPLSMNEDFFFPVNSAGKGSRVEILPGGQNLGEIDDLKYFNNRLMRGLRIPSSYLPTGPEDGTNTVNDGKVGVALIQEWRFNQYCKRLQNIISDVLDREFKMFLRWRGFNIDSSLFKLYFNEPQNFSKNRQAEIDNTRISTFTQLEAIPYLSKRFLLTRYLGLTEEEMAENDKLWAEEHGTRDVESDEEDTNFRNAGITPGGISTDLEGFGGLEGELGGGLEGEPGAAGIAQPGQPAAPNAAGSSGAGGGI
jgi:hypothetical protein